MLIWTYASQVWYKKLASVVDANNIERNIKGSCHFLVHITIRTSSTKSISMLNLPCMRSLAQHHHLLQSMDSLPKTKE